MTSNNDLGTPLLALDTNLVTGEEEEVLKRELGSWVKAQYLEAVNMDEKAWRFNPDILVRRDDLAAFCNDELHALKRDLKRCFQRICRRVHNEILTEHQRKRIDVTMTKIEYEKEGVRFYLLIYLKPETHKAISFWGYRWVFGFP